MFGCIDQMIVSLGGWLQKPSAMRLRSFEPFIRSIESI